MQNSPSDTTNTMSVDIRLCGNIPRNEMKDRFGGAPLTLTALTSRTGISAHRLAETNGGPTLPKTVCDSSFPSAPALILQNSTNNNDKMARGVLVENQQHHSQPLAPVLEPPSWAVPARGETRLEPVCESLGRQTAVDLTSKKAFRIGRSPNCDIQLMHATSSRRHAMLFHHSNGSCYIVDCGSAHGTYVNGKPIPSPATSGVVVPYKVRRGALIRFGGPGAPCFVLKSFSFHLNDVVVEATESADEAQQVRRNTRLNALGNTAQERVRGNLSYHIEQALAVARKRSFDSLCSRDTLDMDEYEHDCKRVRCSSPPLLEEPPPFRLVTPELSSLPQKRNVHFSLEPPQAFYPAAVTPEEWSGDEDN